MTRFRNLVFEGDGVRRVAYAAAIRVLEKKGIVAEITRAAGAVKSMKPQGPFQIGPMSIEKVYSEADGFFDADWYFEMF